MKAVATLVVLVVVAGFGATSVFAEGSGKANLYSSPGYDCSEGATATSGPSFGFVVLNVNAEGTLSAQVSLKGATPNATYEIWVNQDPGACPLDAPTEAAALTTNRNGNGNAHVTVDVVESAEHFWISAVSGAEVLRSTAVELE